MNRLSRFLFAPTALALALVCSNPGHSRNKQVLDDTCWDLTFNEEFKQLSLWDPEKQQGRWKTDYIWDRDTIINNELQYYIDPNLHGESPFSIDNSVLTISATPTPAALKAKVKGSRYISGLLTTQKDFSQRYGRFEIRAKVPAGRGLWPAFWLLPSFDQWPEGVAILPEIDVMEFIGSEVQTYHTTVHTNESGELKSYPYDHNELGDLTQEFHLYSAVWDKDTISWYLDGQLMVSNRTPDDLHQPMHFLLNLAVGGNWAGSPDNTTTFPAEYQVDYVRAYSRLSKCS